jgi:hypothetical protein
LADIDFRQVAASLAIVSDVTGEGSAAGTAFANMWRKLADPQEKANKLLKKWNIELVDAETGQVNVAKVITQFSQRLNEITDPMDRAKKAIELFGARGARAYVALSKRGGPELEKLVASMANTEEGAKGAAKAMAEIRMDNVAGDVVKLTSAMEGLNLGFLAGIFGGEGRKAIQFVTRHIQGVTMALDILNGEVGEFKLKEKFGAAADTFMKMAKGMREGANVVKNVITDIIAKMREWGASFGKDNLKNIVKWITIFVLVAAALAPVIFGIIMIGLAVSAITSIIAGAAGILTGAFLPVLAIVGVLWMVFQSLRRENETFGETAVRVWGELKTWALDLWHNVLEPIWEGIKEAARIVIPELARVFKESFGIAKEAVKDLFKTLGVEIGSGKQGWKDMARTAVFVIAAIIEAVVKLTMYIIIMVVQAVKMFKLFFGQVMDSVLSPFIEVWNLLSDVYQAFEMVFAGDIIGGLKHFGKALLNFVLAPLRSLIRHIVRLADAIPGLGDTIPQALRDFANVGTIGLTAVGDAPPTTHGKRGVPPFLKKRDKVTGEIIAKESASGDLGKLMENLRNIKDSITEGTKEGGKEVKDKLDALLEETKKQPCVDSNVSVAIDNETVARGQARHKAEVGERAGFSTTHWQRRTALEHGAAPVRGRA